MSINKLISCIILVFVLIFSACKKNKTTSNIENSFTDGYSAYSKQNIYETPIQDTYLFHSLYIQDKNDIKGLINIKDEVRKSGGLINYLKQNSETEINYAHLSKGNYATFNESPFQFEGNFLLIAKVKPNKKYRSLRSSYMSSSNNYNIDQNFSEQFMKEENVNQPVVICNFESKYCSFLVKNDDFFDLTEVYLLSLDADSLTEENSKNIIENAAKLNSIDLFKLVIPVLSNLFVELGTSESNAFSSLVFTKYAIENNNSLDSKTLFEKLFKDVLEVSSPNLAKYVTEYSQISFEIYKKLTPFKKNPLSPTYKIKNKANRQAYLFHYTNADIGFNHLKPGEIASWKATGDKGGLLRWVWDKMSAAYKFNTQEENPIKSDLVVGDGIYFAEDPFSSKQFGNQLIILKTALNVQGIYFDKFYINYAADANKGILSIVKKKDHEYVPAIFYNYAGIFNHIAVVVRHSDFIDKSDGIVIKKPNPIMGFMTPIPEKEVLEKLEIPELIVALFPYKERYDYAEINIPECTDSELLDEKKCLLLQERQLPGDKNYLRYIQGKIILSKKLNFGFDAFISAEN